MSWTTTRLVEFQHCDPAGIVFYPRYFEMLNSVIEELFRKHLGYAFGPMHKTDRRGVPTATIKVDFHSPSFLEDRLDFTLHVERVGQSSVTFRIEVSCDGAARLTSTSTLVQTDLESRRSTAWPDPVRQKLQSI